MSPFFYDGKAGGLCQWSKHIANGDQPSNMLGVFGVNVHTNVDARKPTPNNTCRTWEIVAEALYTNTISYTKVAWQKIIYHGMPALQCHIRSGIHAVILNSLIKACCDILRYRTPCLLKFDKFQKQPWCTLREILLINRCVINIKP